MKKIYKVTGMHCPSCAMVIEADLEDSGIKARCSYANQTLEVEGGDNPTDEIKLKRVVEKSGYALTD